MESRFHYYVLTCIVAQTWFLHSVFSSLRASSPGILDPSAHGFGNALAESQKSSGSRLAPSHHAQKTSGVESRLRWTAARLKRRSKTATVARLCFFSLRIVASVLGETTARRVVNFLIFFVQNPRDKRYYAK